MFLISASLQYIEVSSRFCSFLLAMRKYTRSDRREKIMIFLIADIHSRKDRLERHIARIEKKISRPLDARDTLVCLGDLFGATKRTARSFQGKMLCDRKLVSYIASQPYTMVCIRGNHDNDKRLYRLGARRTERFGGLVEALGDNLLFLDDGGIYTLPLDAKNSHCGTVSVLALGGAFSHMYRLRGEAPLLIQQMKTQYAPLLHATKTIKVDYVLSHDCPATEMPFLVKQLFGKTPMNDILEQVKKNICFCDWFYGHHHMDNKRHSHYHGIYRNEITLEKIGAHAKRANSAALKCDISHITSIDRR